MVAQLLSHSGVPRKRGYQHNIFICYVDSLVLFKLLIFALVITSAKINNLNNIYYAIKSRLEY